MILENICLYLATKPLPLLKSMWFMEIFNQKKKKEMIIKILHESNN